MEDSEILLLLNKRDETAVAALVERFGGLCRSVMGNILRDRRDVEECLNSVLMRLWSSIPPARPKDLAAYTAKAARNEALMRLRRNGAALEDSKLPLDELELFLPASESAEDGIALRELIELFLKKQSEERRRIFILRYWFFEPVEAIAEKCGVSQSKVTSLLFRTRNSLRKYLESEGWFDE